MDDATAQFRAILLGTAMVANAVSDKIAAGLYSTPGDKALLLKRAREAQVLLTFEAEELAAAIEAFESAEESVGPQGPP